MSLVSAVTVCDLKSSERQQGVLADAGSTSLAESTLPNRRVFLGVSTGVVAAALSGIAFYYNRLSNHRQTYGTASEPSFTLASVTEERVTPAVSRVLRDVADAYGDAQRSVVSLKESPSKVALFNRNFEALELAYSTLLEQVKVKGHADSDVLRAQREGVEKCTALLSPFQPRISNPFMRVVEGSSRAPNLVADEELEARYGPPHAFVRQLAARVTGKEVPSSVSIHATREKPTRYGEHVDGYNDGWSESIYLQRVGYVETMVRAAHELGHQFCPGNEELPLLGLQALDFESVHGFQYGARVREEAAAICFASALSAVIPDEQLRRAYSYECFTYNRGHLTHYLEGGREPHACGAALYEVLHGSLPAEECWSRIVSDADLGDPLSRVDVIPSLESALSERKRDYFVAAGNCESLTAAMVLLSKFSDVLKP